MEQTGPELFSRSSRQTDGAKLSLSGPAEGHKATAGASQQSQPTRRSPCGRIRSSFDLKPTPLSRCVGRLILCNALRSP